MRETTETDCGPVTVVTIPAGSDNYIYLLDWGAGVAVVDPGEADPVLRELDRRRRPLEAILITHGHWDHVAGLETVRPQGGRVIGPAAVDGVTEAVDEGDEVDVGPLRFRIIATPGHTPEHVCFHAPAAALLFSGDTLFVGGCGRIMGSDAATMWTSLSKLAALPDGTAVFCGHEYTEENLRFALSTAPEDAAYGKRADAVRALRAKDLPSVPSTIGEERRSNIFLRAGDARAFADLRSRKDRF